MLLEDMGIRGSQAPETTQILEYATFKYNNNTIIITIM